MLSRLARAPAPSLGGGDLTRLESMPRGIEHGPPSFLARA